MKVMKRVAVLVCIIVAVWGMVTCHIGQVQGWEQMAAANNERLAALEKEVNTPHELRRMLEKDIASESSSYRFTGGFFLFAGAVSGSGEAHKEIRTFVTFAWKMGDGTYAINRVPLENVRVKLDEQCVQPTAQFFTSVTAEEYSNQFRRESAGGYRTRLLHNGPQKFLERYLMYMVITCRPEDWQPQIEMPMQSTKGR